ncbi:MAG: Crp/Fnr family transcriptional regulator [Chitinophagaceae bacterium]|nr:Crp/Fnr family transcriptional regulator [Chitinophagaceae bacterium]
MKHCERSAIDSISRFKQTRFIKKGDILFREGEIVKGIFFIKKGVLKIEIFRNHKPLILQLSGRGCILGHRTTEKSKVHLTTVTAVTDSTYCFIPLEHFNKILDNSPLLKKQLHYQLLKELELIEKKALHLAHKTVREKVAEALLLLSEFYNYQEQLKTFRINFCRTDIANIAGTTKEQVSKTLKDFEREKLIKCIAKKFSYLNIEKLQDLSEGNEIFAVRD